MVAGPGPRSSQLCPPWPRLLCEARFCHGELASWWAWTGISNGRCRPTQGERPEPDHRRFWRRSGFLLTQSLQPVPASPEEDTSWKQGCPETVASSPCPWPQAWPPWRQMPWGSFTQDRAGQVPARDQVTQMRLLHPP